MARVGSYTHVAQDANPVAAGTSFAAAKVHTLSIAPPTQVAAARKFGRLGALYVYLDTIVTAATVTIRVTRDAAGDECLVPDTSSTIYAGITDATDGSAVFDLDIPFALLTLGTVYVFLSIDAGTANWAESSLTWQE